MIFKGKTPTLVSEKNNVHTILGVTENMHREPCCNRQSKLMNMVLNLAEPHIIPEINNLNKFAVTWKNYPTLFCTCDLNCCIKSVLMVTVKRPLHDHGHCNTFTPFCPPPPPSSKTTPLM